MNTKKIDIPALEAALERKEFDKVAETLDEVFKKKLSREEIGETYGTLVTLYLKAINGIEYRYLVRLEQLVARYKGKV